MSLAQSGKILRSDLIYDFASKQSIRARFFSDLEPYLPPVSIGEIIEDVITGAVSAVAVIGIGLGVEMLVESIFTPPRPAPKACCRTPNNELLEAWKRGSVREQDAELCDYCGRYDPQGHVDHKTSRVNGGK